MKARLQRGKSESSWKDIQKKKLKKALWPLRRAASENKVQDAASSPSPSPSSTIRPPPASLLPATTAEQNGYATLKQQLSSSSSATSTAAALRSKKQHHALLRTSSNSHVKSAFRLHGLMEPEPRAATMRTTAKERIRRKGEPQQMTLMCIQTLSGVGCSSLNCRFATGSFSTEETLEEPIEELRIKKVSLDEEKEVRLELLNCSGRKQFRALRKQYIEAAEGFLCVMDITNKESALKVPKILAEIAWIKQKDLRDIPVVLVANKADEEEAREVSAEELLLLSQCYSCPCFETSAKTGQNVEESYLSLINQKQRVPTPHHTSFSASFRNGDGRTRDGGSRGEGRHGHGAVATLWGGGCSTPRDSRQAPHHL